ncbi:MAG: molecular chaperone [Paracoccaceae bacterium]
MHADAFATPPEAPPVSETVEVLEAQSGLYTLLGRCIESEVDADLLGLLRGALGDAVGEIGLDLGADVMNAPERQVLHTLAEEYTSLFVAPGAASPFRSVFESGRLFQTQADLAAAAYREAGFAFRNVHSGEFADHIGVMLTFVGRLLGLEAEALRDGDADAAAGWRARRERFLLRQLAPWAVGWCRRARACARHDFYRAILDIVERTVWEDASAIADVKTLKRLVAANKRPLMRPKSDPEFRKASGL